MISDVPNGGSGKGLLNYAVSMIKKMGDIDGKNYKHLARQFLKENRLF